MNSRYHYILILIFLVSCEAPPAPDVPRNPIHEDHPDFVPPVTTLTEGPADGSTIDQPSVSFQWEGNETAEMFQYLLNDGVWSAWGPETSITLNYLDELSYTFAVRSRHQNGGTIEENYPERSFTVDAVKGPALRFFPRRKPVQSSASFEYDLFVEEIESPDTLHGAKILVRFDSNLLAVDSVRAGPFAGQNGGEAILFYEIDNNAGTVLIELAVVGGEPQGVTGSGALANLECTALGSGTAVFDIDSVLTEYRNLENQTITMKEIVDGMVVIE